MACFWPAMIYLLSRKEHNIMKSALILFISLVKWRKTYFLKILILVKQNSKVKGARCDARNDTWVKFYCKTSSAYRQQ